MSTQITPHFTWEEATQTSTGLPNLTSPEERARITHTAHQMEIVRAVLGRNPISVSSWFRSAAVNQAVGGVPGSEHRIGAAVDFKCPAFGTPYEIARSLLSNAHILNYNQLIYEQTWIHISFPPDGVRGKNEVLTMKNGRYTQGINL